MTGLMHRRRVLRGVATLPLAIASGLVGAADDPDVLVTASRFTQPVSDSLWSSNVLTRAQIEARQPQSVQDLLWGQAGIDLDNAGGLGKATSVFLRGTEGDHTLLLIDGVRVGSVTVGVAPYELIPVDQIERIEVVRGPRSTLYGSEAIGGVIQIFTRGGTRSGLSFGGSATGASHDTRRISANLQGGAERAWFSISGERQETDGINACAGAPFPPGGGCWTHEPDRDGYRNDSGTLTAGFRFNDRLSAEVRTLVADGHSEYDGTFSNWLEFTERVTSLSVRAGLGESWQMRAIVGRNDDEQQNYLDDLRQGRFDTQRESASVQIDGPITSQLRLVSGADYLDDSVSSTTQYDVSSRETTGVFTELHGQLGAWSGLIGARYEDNEQFGGHTVGNVGFGWKLGETHRLSATWGSAFRAPSFNELYFPGFGNPELDPEKSKSVELGVTGAAGALQWSLNAYQTEVDDLILFDVVTFLSQNIARSRVRGAELQAQWSTGRWSLAGQITRSNPINESPDANRGKLLPRRAKESASLEVRHLWASGWAGITGRWQGSRYNDLGNTERLGSYFTADLLAEQAIGQGFTLQARVANLLDRDYETARFYPQDGRNYSLTLRYRFAAE